jgi:hypothetical protein
MLAAIVRNLPEKTGPTLDEWIVLMRAEGPERRRDRIEWLKKVHAVGHVTATVIADAADAPSDETPPTPDEFVSAQYAGDKSALRAIYSRLAKAIVALGPDARPDPRQTYVSFVRQRQFAIVRASTKSRVDVGLVLPGAAETDRLQPARSFGSERITHRVALTSPDDVDGELLGWLRAAYERDAPA